MRHAILTSFLLVFTAIGVAQGAPTLSFTATTVTAHGVTPGGRVILFSVARESRYYYSVIVRRVEVLSDADGDGQIAYAIARGVPRKAIWAVVDLVSGEYVVQPTTGYENYPTVFSADVLKHDNNGQIRKLEVPFSEMQVLLARPGTGGWWVEAGKNSEVDENKDNPYGIRIDLSIMHPLPGTPPAPNNVKKGDVLVFVDPRWMLYSFLEVKQ